MFMFARAVLLPSVLLGVPTAPVGLPPASPAAAASPIEIPFEMSPRGHIMVQVSVDGGAPVPFALDTGAGITILNQARLAALGVSERSTADVAQRAHGTVALGRADLETLSLGAADFGRLEVGVLELTDVEAGQMVLYGVLGFDVLSRYDVAIDFEDRTVVLHPRAEDLASCVVCAGDISTTFDLAGGTHIVFDVTISEKPVRAVLDTGSGRSAMNRLAAAAIGVELPDGMPGGHGAPGLSVGAILMGQGTLARNTPVGVMDLPVFEPLGMAEGPAILLGTGTISGRRIGISYGLNRISIE